MLCSRYLPFLKNVELHTANTITVIPKFLEALNWDHCGLRLSTGEGLAAQAAQIISFLFSWV